jgi:hypothetical protein
MQNEANFIRFSPENADFNKKRTQFEAKRTQFWANIAGGKAKRSQNEPNL